MSQQITLRIRPGEMVRFPNRCVACGQPATERLTLRNRRGQLTRRLDAPLCGDCGRQLARRSGREEQLRRAGGLAAAAAGFGLLVAVVVLAGGAWWLRGGLGLLAGGAVAWLVWWLSGRRAEAAQLPETCAVRASAQLVDFSWRDITLAFADEAIAAAVLELNTILSPDAAGPEGRPSPELDGEPRPLAGEPTDDYDRDGG